MTTFDQDSDGHEISLTSGDEFEIRLPENPTTGFRWQVTNDGAPACKILDDEFRAPDAARPGQPGLHVWRMRIVAAGGGAIELINSRARSAGAASGRTYTLRVHAREQ